MNTTTAYIDRLGERGVIIGKKHPHTGKSGKYMGLQPTLVGPAMLIELDDGHRCYVYDKANFKFIGELK